MPSDTRTLHRLEATSAKDAASMLEALCKERDALQLLVHSLKLQLRDAHAAKEAKAESDVVQRLQRLEALVDARKPGTQAQQLTRPVPLMYHRHARVRPRTGRWTSSYSSTLSSSLEPTSSRMTPCVTLVAETAQSTIARDAETRHYAAPCDFHSLCSRSQTIMCRRQLGLALFSMHTMLVYYV